MLGVGAGSVALLKWRRRERRGKQKTGRRLSRGAGGDEEEDRRGHGDGRGQTRPSHNPVCQAADAIADWMETHGGEVRLLGQGCNLPSLADALRWTEVYLPTCGRLDAFLTTYGCSSPADPNIVVGMVFDQA